MLSQRRDNARLQGDFYRDQYRKILRWLLVTTCLIIVLILAIIYCILFQPQRRYYANTIEGKILLMPQQSAVKQ